MIHLKPFTYKPVDDELDKATNSYLMSLIALMVGLPLPIVNLIATFIFYVANKKATQFVRWHCTQALLSQLSLFVINSIAVIWTIRVLTDKVDASNLYIAYIVTVLVTNLTEFIVTVYTSIKVRKGQHVEWWFYGDLANEIVKNKEQHGQDHY